SHADGRSYTTVGDPDDASLLGFNAISLPEFDHFAVPFWAIVLACALYQVWWLTQTRDSLTPTRYSLAQTRYRRRFAAGCCVQCGYNLRGLIDSPRCPECGHERPMPALTPAPPATDRAKRHAALRTA